MRVFTAVLVVFLAALAYGGGDSGLTGYWSCQSAADQDTIYFSSTWDGTAHNDDKAFAQFLTTKYGYNGRATCSLLYKAGNTLATLQRSHDAKVSQWRSQGKKVVETGWTNNGAPALTAAAPEGPVTPVVADKPKAPAPDPDDQPMAAKKSPDDHPMAAKKDVPMSHFYCATQKSGDKPLYFTGAFEAPSSELAAVDHAFQAYLSQKYGYAGPIAVSCYNQPSVAAADQRKQAAIISLKKTPATVIDTGWKYQGQ